jgi:hypothetical protein
MPTLRIAHVLEQGQNLIIIPLESSFGTNPVPRQQEITAELQMRANAAGLIGTVVPVWDGGQGRMAFLAPIAWHAFFRSINLQWVGVNLNRELFW